MCGHGTSLGGDARYLAGLSPAIHVIETPVGSVAAELHESGEVTVTNVTSYRLASQVEVNVDGYGPIRGDVAWGGNWFFLVSEHNQELTLARVEELTDFTWRIREALARDGITGKYGKEIDHIELFGAASDGRADSKNFCAVSRQGV